MIELVSPTAARAYLRKATRQDFEALTDYQRAALLSATVGDTRELIDSSDLFNLVLVFREAGMFEPDEVAATLHVQSLHWMGQPSVSYLLSDGSVYPSAPTAVADMFDPDLVAAAILDERSGNCAAQLAALAAGVASAITLFVSLRSHSSIPNTLLGVGAITLGTSILGHATHSYLSYRRGLKSGPSGWGIEEEPGPERHRASKALRKRKP